jgi:primosomal protein N'
VALCLRGDNVDSGLLGEIGAVFAPMFSKEAHLDLIIVDEEQEDELAKVCRPFWELA